MIRKKFPAEKLFLIARLIGYFIFKNKKKRQSRRNQGSTEAIALRNSSSLKGFDTAAIKPYSL